MQNNPNSKRGLVNKNQTTTLVLVAVAAAISVTALMISKGLWSQTSYLNKVTDKKEAAVKQLKSNKDAVASLTETYKSFDEKSPNLLGGSPDGTGPRDGSNGTLILDALPSRYDFPALITSLEKLLEGYTIQAITGTDDSMAQSQAAPGQSVEIPFAISVNTNYDGLKRLIDTFDKSIRPFHITSMRLEGVSSRLNVNIQAKTYYQPEKGVEITSKVVQ